MKEQQEKYTLPPSWINASLGDILTLEYGKSLPKDSRKDGKYPIFGSNGIIGYHNDFLVEGPTIIIGRKGSVGSIHISNENCWPIDTTYFIKLIPSLNLKFIFYRLKYLNLSQLDKSTTIPGLNRESVYNETITLPHIEEQQAIVLQIDSLFSKLEEAEKALQKATKGLKIYKQVLLKYAFEGKLTEKWRRTNNPKSTRSLLDNIENERQAKYELELLEWNKLLKEWKEKKIGLRPSKPSKPITPDKPNDTHTSKKWELPQVWEWSQIGLISFITKLAGFEYTEYVRYNEKGDLSVIKAENAGPDGFKKTMYSKVLSESVDQLKRSQLKGGELIIVFVGNVGNVATVPENIPFFLGPNVAMVRPYNGIRNKFIEYFYQSPKGRDMLLSTAKAVAQPSLSMGDIRQTPIAIPSNKEQLIIIEIIENRFTLTGNLERTIENMRSHIISLRHSILKKAFEGKIINYTSNKSHGDLLQIMKEEKRLYLEFQKEVSRNKPKQKKHMDKKKSILEILKESEEPISAQDLWEKSTSDGDIERFYNEIKEIYDQIVEIKSETESLLSIKNED